MFRMASGHLLGDPPGKTAASKICASNRSAFEFAYEVEMASPLTYEEPVGGLENWLGGLDRRLAKEVTVVLPSNPAPAVEGKAVSPPDSFVHGRVALPLLRLAALLPPNKSPREEEFDPKREGALALGCRIWLSNAELAMPAWLFGLVSAQGNVPTELGRGNAAATSRFGLRIVVDKATIPPETKTLSTTTTTTTNNSNNNNNNNNNTNQQRQQ